MHLPCIYGSGEVDVEFVVVLGALVDCQLFHKV
jgi:hypothetical protein